MSFYLFGIYAIVVSMKKQIKALVLFSGGLDSMLAVELLKRQNIEIDPVFFYTNFTKADLAQKSARQLGIKLREVDLREDFLEVLKNPKHGYGSGLNPCIDCHLLMLKKAGEIMRAEGFNFIATGEVLGERPMSQNKQSLEIIEKEAGISGYLLRPLSAKLLEETISEKNGLIDRDLLLDVSGRNRQKQIALAAEFGIKKFPSPGGGCALTEKGFAGKIKNLMEQKLEFDSDDAELIKIGRHFWFGKTWIALGRSEDENNLLVSLARIGDMILEPEGPGALALLRGENITGENIEKAKNLILEFSLKLKADENLKFMVKVIES